MPARPANEPNQSSPAERTSFVGRRTEQADLRRLLGRHRLVTVTGVGGVGKSRLARRVASRAGRAYPDGVHVVEFGQLDDPAWLVPTVAAAPGCPSPAGEPPRAQLMPVAPTSVAPTSVAPPCTELPCTEPPWAEPPWAEPALAAPSRDQPVSRRPGPRGHRDTAALCRLLAPKRLLLVLDDCEHLVDDCAQLVDALLDACPDLRMLVTSREPLRVEGECTYRLKPFAVAQTPGSNGVGDRDAVTLFLDRARAVRSEFELGDDDAAVREICRRLEGLPLGVELAASRIRALPPAEILDHLAAGIEIVRHDSRQATARQRSQRASAGWSYDLCTAQERRLWARLSVFADGFELDAAAAVAGGAGLADQPLELVLSLVDKSVL